MSSFHRAKCLRIFEIQSILKYIFLHEKRPKFVQLNPQPKKVVVVNTNGFYKLNKPIPILSTFDIKTIFKNLLNSIEIEESDNLDGLINEKSLLQIEKQNIEELFEYSKLVKNKIFDQKILENFDRPDKKTPYFVVAIDCEMMEVENDTKVENDEKIGNASKVENDTKIENYKQLENHKKLEINDKQLENNDIEKKIRKQIGRLSIVDANGNVILDKYVKSKGKVSDYLTQYSGLTEENTKNGIEYYQMIKELKNIVGINTWVVGHGLENDFEGMNFFTDKIIDTAYLYLSSDGYKMGLGSLSIKFFSEDIQNGSHDSVKDAQGSMKLLARRILENKLFIDGSKGVFLKSTQINEISEAENKEGLFFIELTKTENFSDPNSYFIFLGEKGGEKFISFQGRKNSKKIK